MNGLAKVFIFYPICKEKLFEYFKQGSDYCIYVLEILLWHRKMD